MNRRPSSGTVRKKRNPYRNGRRNRSYGRYLIFLIMIVAIILFFFNRCSLSKDENTSSSGTTSSQVVSSIPSSSSSVEPSSTASSSQATDNPDRLVPAKEPDISGASIDELNTMMIVGNRGFRYYTFSESTSIDYIELVKKISEIGTGKASFYSMIVPTATDITLSQDFLKDKSTSDQQKALDYLNASIQSVAPEVKSIPLFDILKANCDKKIYFDTDRNWTSLGAYYAYRQFCSAKGFTATALDDYTEKTYEGFTGSLYAQSDSRAELGGGETLTVYEPSYSVDVTIGDYNGEDVAASMFVDVSDYPSDEKYYTYFGGSFPSIEITNANITAQSACLVIKDSYGNPFIPYLTAHYNKVYVIDYRYYSGDFQALVDSGKYQDILLINHIEATSDAEAISSIIALI